MPDRDDLRALLEARFQAEQAEPEDRVAAQARVDQLVTVLCREANCSRHSLLEAISHAYREYRRGRLVEERRQGQR